MDGKTLLAQKIDSYPNLRFTMCYEPTVTNTNTTDNDIYLPRTIGGEGERRSATAITAARRPRRSAPRADGRAGCVAADVRQEAGVEARCRKRSRGTAVKISTRANGWGERHRGWAVGRDQRGSPPQTRSRDNRGDQRSARRTAWGVSSHTCDREWELRPAAAKDISNPRG